MATGGIAATNCYVVIDEEAKEGVLFDAPNDTVASVLDEVEQRGVKLVGLYSTVLPAANQRTFWKSTKTVLRPTGRCRV